MSYAIVYSSKSGNTKKLAEAIRAPLPMNECFYFGEPDLIALQASTIFIGSWVDKGRFDSAILTFMKQLKQKQIALFATAGFGGSQAYFDDIIARVKTEIDASNTILGNFMCQGKMPLAIRYRYEKMLEANPDDANAIAFIQNFDQASTHPDEDDIAHVQLFCKSCMQQHNQEDI